MDARKREKRYTDELAEALAMGPMSRKNATPEVEVGDGRIQQEKKYAEEMAEALAMGPISRGSFKLATESKYDSVAARDAHPDE